MTIPSGTPARWPRSPVKNPGPNPASCATSPWVRFRFDRICPFPGLDRPERPEYTGLMARLRDYLLQEIDPLAIDETGEFPDDIIPRLAALVSRPEYPHQLRRAGPLQTRVLPRTRTDEQLRKQPHGIHQSPPVGRRA